MIPVVPRRHVVDELQLGIAHGNVDREEAASLGGGDPPVPDLAVSDGGEGISAVAGIAGEEDGAVGEGHEIVTRAIRAVGGGVQNILQKGGKNTQKNDIKTISVTQITMMV